MNAFHLREAGLTRAHRPFLWVAAGAAVAAALVLCGLLPGSTPPSLPPLHAQCIGALYLTLADMLAVAARAIDVVASRVPLLATCAATAGLALAWVPAGAALLWPAAHSVVAVLVRLLLRSDTSLQAPAEHPHRALAALGGWGQVLVRRRNRQGVKGESPSQ